MNVEEIKLYKFLKKPVNFTVPIYQRKYSWTNKECEQLLKDILEITNSNKETYFMGFLVHEMVFEDYQIIDGQQRLTSISLLIAALLKFLNLNKEQLKECDIDKKIEDYLVNTSLNKKYKLVLNEDDQNTYEKIIDSILDSKEVSNADEGSENLYKNFNYFYANISIENFYSIVNGIKKLRFVRLQLEKSEDPQKVFESLNSTGKDLNNSDLIKNYLLMNLDNIEQNLIFKIWHPIELIFESTYYSFDDFIYNFLHMKFNTKITKEAIYDKFIEYSKRYFPRDFEGIELLVKDVEKYVGYFSCIALGKEKNEELNDALKNLNKLSYTTTHPFLFKLYDDYSDNKLSSEEFTQIVEYTESFVFRRYILGLDSQNLRGIYLKMYEKLDKNNYLESYLYNLLKLEDNKRMPTDEEFKEALFVKNLFDLNRNKLYLFDRLENYKEKVYMDIYPKEFQIEHIMPQTLTNQWKEELGNDYKMVYKTYLNTIGNLTVFEYNPEVSNKTFLEKKQYYVKGDEKSVLRLNRYFEDIKKWDEEEIIKRGTLLCDKSLEIWKYPENSESILNNFDSIKNQEEDI